MSKFVPHVVAVDVGPELGGEEKEAAHFSMQRVNLFGRGTKSMLEHHGHHLLHPGDQGFQIIILFVKFKFSKLNGNTYLSGGGSRISYSP